MIPYMYDNEDDDVVSFHSFIKEEEESESSEDENVKTKNKNKAKY